MKNRPEEDLQIEIVQYWNYIKDTLPKKTLLQSIRNENNQGGWRGAKKGQIYKQMGRQVGFPDLILLIEGEKTVFIELKAEERCITLCGAVRKGLGLSQEQIATHKVLRELGFKVYVFWSLAQFKEILQ